MYFRADFAGSPGFSRSLRRGPAFFPALVVLYAVKQLSKPLLANYACGWLLELGTASSLLSAALAAPPNAPSRAPGNIVITGRVTTSSNPPLQRMAVLV